MKAYFKILFCLIDSEESNAYFFFNFTLKLCNDATSFETNIWW
jgi:hypothetical protein